MQFLRSASEPTFLTFQYISYGLGQSVLSIKNSSCLLCRRICLGQYRKATAQEDNILMKPKEGKEYADKKIRSKYN